MCLNYPQENSLVNLDKWLRITAAVANELRVHVCRLWATGELSPAVREGLGLGRGQPRVTL